MTDIMIRAEGLVRAFGATPALRGVDLEVPAGTVLGLLGPNGAGKTTTVRILTTLLRPDAGRAEVAGHGVTDDPQRVRRLIGLTGQYAAVDENLTGTENLVMIGRLLDLPRRGPHGARARADALLERFDLADAADRLTRTYSGGMRRRLDLAASLVGEPRVLFLDEPTTGLDPRSRSALWDVVRDLVGEGTTVLLTTQYLEEADALADAIAVVDAGQVIARGTAHELKARTGGATLRLVPADPVDVPAALLALADLGAQRDDAADAGTRAPGWAVTVPVGEDTGIVAAAVRHLDDAGIAIADLGLRRPSLDDVFLALTGRSSADGTSTGAGGADTTVVDGSDGAAA